MENKRIRMTVDIGMAVLLPFLMAYSLIGETFHEIAGTLMTVLIVIHLVQNRKWIAAIPKGKYGPVRIFQTVLDLLLLVFMVLQPLSGILMSKHLYVFIRIPGVSSVSRRIHMALAYWGYILMSVHAGTHLTAPFKKVSAKKGAARTCAFLICAAVCLYGAYAFWKRQFPDYLFFRSMFAFFDYSGSRVIFILDYLSIMFLFAVIGLIIRTAPGRWNPGKGRKE